MNQKNREHSREFLAELYRTLYTIRLFENRCIKLYRQGLIRGYFHPYLGEEAIAVGVCAALEERDYITSTHRGHGHCIARGGDLGKMVAEVLGKATGYCGGRGGSMHIADITKGNLGANGIVGGGIPIGVGAALASKIRGEDRVSVVFCSDGAVTNGIFGESLNLAAAWRLPAVFVIENNQYAVCTPIEAATGEPELHKRGVGYGVKSWRIDGNEVLDVHACAEEAVSLCRKGEGPALIEAVTYRHSGHHVNDPGAYMPKEKLEHYKAHDPVDIGRKCLLEKGGATEDEVKVLESEVERRMEEAVEFAVGSEEPSVESFIEEVGSY